MKCSYIDKAELRADFPILDIGYFGGYSFVSFEVGFPLVRQSIRAKFRICITLASPMYKGRDSGADSTSGGKKQTDPTHPRQRPVCGKR